MTAGLCFDVMVSFAYCVLIVFCLIACLVLVVCELDWFGFVLAVWVLACCAAGVWCFIAFNSVV